MAKNKKANKVLVRNSSVPLRSNKTCDKANNLKKVHFSEDVPGSPDMDKPPFSVPEFCSLLHLADEMKVVRNAHDPSRSLSGISKCKNLNFMPGERIYHDLVGLEVPDEVLVNEVKSQPCVKLKKDPELDFHKYLKNDLEPEYFFTSVAVPFVKHQKNSFNGHSIYNKMAIWRECTDQ